MCELRGVSVTAQTLWHAVDAVESAVTANRETQLNARCLTLYQKKLNACRFIIIIIIIK